MAAMNISLPGQMKSWVEKRTDGAAYANSSDYVRHLIRRDQERQLAVDEGESSGYAENFTFDEGEARKRGEYEQS